MMNKKKTSRIVIDVYYVEVQSSRPPAFSCSTRNYPQQPSAMILKKCPAYEYMEYEKRYERFIQQDWEKIRT